jgi:uncharacterized protein (DUF4213/DUF364 family)
MIYKQIAEEAMPLLRNAKILDYIFGLSYIAVKTDLGTGVAYTYRNALDGCVRFTENDMRGYKAATVAEKYFSDNLFEAGLGLAVINSALNNKLSTREDFLKPENFQNKKVGMVGYFRPMLKWFAKAGAELKIFELKDIEGTYKPEQAPEIMPECDIVIITGVTLINKTLHTYTPYINKDAIKILMGPTVTMSNYLLSQGFLLGGTKINNFDKLFHCLARGLSSKDFDGSAEKVWL